MKTLVLLLLIPAVLLASALYLNASLWLAAPGPIDRVKTWLGQNRVETSPEHAWPELRSLILPGTLSQVRPRVLSAIDALGWQLQQQQETLLDVVVTTAVWRFKDDVQIRLTPLDSAQVQIDVIAQSRLGKGDLGANNRHVVRLYEQIGTTGKGDD